MKKQTGFSLIELLIAMTILATAYLMLLGVFPVSMQSVKQGKDVLFATQLAQQQMEKALYQNFTDYPLSVSNATATLSSTVNNVTTTTGFTYSVTFDPDDSSVSTSSIKNIVVIVYVTNKPERNVKLETYISREP